MQHFNPSERMPATSASTPVTPASIANSGDATRASGSTYRLRNGLSPEEAAAQLLVFGPNELPKAERRGFFKTIADVFAEPMFVLLAVAAGIYIIIGDFIEGLVLACFAGLSTIIVIIQERRSENALEALRALGAPKASAIRGGVEIKIPARDLVPGDIIRVSEGERVAADAIIWRAQELTLDESLLTGEGAPVHKSPLKSDFAGKSPAPGDSAETFLFAGTLVVRGHGLAEVHATGLSTAAGHIGASLATIEIEPTLLQRTIARLVRIFGAVALLVSISLVLFYGLTRGDWLQAVLSGIALAMGMLPEEFPMVLVIFLALGAWRLAQIKVLARRPAVIETLGAATVLCVDKTGTLTENRMRTRALDNGSEQFECLDDGSPLPEPFHTLVEFALLASRTGGYDPMDSAVERTVRDHLTGTEHVHLNWRLGREYGISEELLAMSQVWLDETGTHVIATKGAPEAIADLCHFAPSARQALLLRVQVLAERGLRVLAVARGNTSGPLPDNPHDFDFSFLGLVAFEDPLRSTVQTAMAEAQRAGLKVIMLTGDYPATAVAIAKAAGLDLSGGVIIGSQLNAMDDVGLREAVARCRVFARILPDQKLRLVEALKADGEIVAMTGDGVNDAPALKAAHIGIAMGVRGTDVAREAASIVLLDEDFGRIVAGVRAGRRIFDNLRKAMIYITAIHVPIAGLGLVPILLGLPPLLFPLHVVLIEMVVDPVASLAFENEAEEHDIMDHPPRPMNEPLIGFSQLAIGFLQGLGLFIATLAVYWLALNHSIPESQSRALAFVALTAGNLALVRVNGTRDSALSKLFEPGHLSFWLIAGLISLIVTTSLSFEDVGLLLRFETPSIALIVGAISTGLISVLWFDAMKGSPAISHILGRSLDRRNNQAQSSG